MKNAIEIRNLKKVFHKHTNLINFLLRKRKLTTAVNCISLDIREGEIFGLLGPNGAGKTTLIKILTTLILPTEGIATVNGYEVAKDDMKVRNSIGLIHSDERSFFWRLTGRQNLDFFAAILRVPRQLVKNRVDEAIAHVGLQKHADNLFQYYSTGMKQRLAIARGLLNNPKILFMDEAMRSIDPISTQKIREFIKSMMRVRRDMTIVMATNRLDEATVLCDRVAILNNGRLVKCGNVGEIEAASEGSIQYYIEAKELSDEAVEQIQRMSCIQHCESTFKMNGNVGLLINLAEEGDLHFVLQEIIRNKGHIANCDSTQMSLEESFHEIIKLSNNEQQKSERNTI